MKNNKGNINQIIVFSLIFLIIGGVAGYFIGLKQSQDNPNIPGGNFQEIDEQTKTEINYFFENTQSIDEVNSYCKENPMYCMEYCKNINPDNEFCSNMSMKAPNSNREEFQQK